MKLRTALIFFTVTLLCGLLNGKESQVSEAYIKKRGAVTSKYTGIKPGVFSQWAPGVKTRIDTDEKIAVITLDACGGKKGSGYDRELIDFLRQNKIPASLFMTSLWIDANRELTVELSRDPLFEIENHGYRHKPASVNGAKIYGRRGTLTPADLFDEVELNAEKIQALTGRRPLFYRPGTAYFDEAAVKLCYDLNHIPMNFSVISGDAAGFSAERIERRILSQVKPGSVIIAHMNQPGKSLYPAVKKSLVILKAQGYRFVKLSEYKDKLR